MLHFVFMYNCSSAFVGPVAKFQCSAHWAHPRLAQQFVSTGAVVQQMRKYYTPEMQCVMYVTCLRILIITTHTSRFGTVTDKVDLAGTIIHKWVPMHGIYFTLSFCPLNHAHRLATHYRPTQSSRAPDFSYEP